MTIPLICLIIGVINVTIAKTIFEWELVKDFPSTSTSNFMCGYDSSNDTIWILMDKLNTSPDQVFSLNPNTRVFTSYNTFSAVTTGNCQFYTSAKTKIYAVWSTKLFIFDMTQKTETVYTEPFGIGNSGYCITIHPNNQHLFSIISGWSYTSVKIYNLYQQTLFNGPILNSSAPGVDISCIISTYNKCLYVFMGTTIHKLYVGDTPDTISPLATWITLDTTLSRWVECSQIAQINQQIFIIGGSSSFTEFSYVNILNVTNDIITTNDIVTAGTPLNIGRARGCGVYASKSDSIYVFGGANYGYAEGEQSYEIGRYFEVHESTIPSSDLSPASSASNSLSVIIIFAVIALVIVLVVLVIYFRKKKANMTPQLDSEWQQVTVVHEIKQDVNDNHNIGVVTTTTYDNKMEINDDLPPPYTPEYNDDDRQNIIKVSAPPEDSMNGKKNDMKEWLTNVVGLPQYIDTFIQNGFDDLDCIIHITKDELKEMNVLLGHQVKIMAAVNEMKHNIDNANYQQEKYQNEGGETVQFQ